MVTLPLHVPISTHSSKASNDQVSKFSHITAILILILTAFNKIQAFVQHNAYDPNILYSMSVVLKTSRFPFLLVHFITK